MSDLMQSGAQSGVASLVRILPIVNQRGLHARATSKFVKVVEQFDAEVRVAKNGTEVSGRSILGLMMLGAGPGCAIRVRATGGDAAAVLDALENLVAGRFNEAE